MYFVLYCVFMAFSSTTLSYEKMQAFGATKPVKFCELQGSLEELVDRHALACPHLALTWLKAALSLECEVSIE